MSSNEFRACKKAIQRAKSKNEIAAAVDILDAAWYHSGESKKIMKETDWPRLVLIIHKATLKL